MAPYLDIKTRTQRGRERKKYSTVVNSVKTPCNTINDVCTVAHTVNTANHSQNVTDNLKLIN